MMKIKSNQEWLEGFKEKPVILLGFYLLSVQVGIPFYTNPTLRVVGSIIWFSLFLATVYLVPPRKKEVIQNDLKIKAITP